MIFPRYQQLDAVRKLLAHARAHGPGQQLPDPALGGIGEVEHDRLAGAPGDQRCTTSRTGRSSTRRSS